MARFRELTEGCSIPIGVAVDGANRHDTKLARATIARVVVARPAPTEKRPQGMWPDKGDDDEVRARLRAFGFTAHMRSHGAEAKEIARKAGKRARRWVAERSHSWLDRFRCLPIRWEKKPERYFSLPSRHRQRGAPVFRIGS